MCPGAVCVWCHLIENHYLKFFLCISSDSFYTVIGEETFKSVHNTWYRKRDFVVCAINELVHWCYFVGNSIVPALFSLTANGD